MIKYESSLKFIIKQIIVSAISKISAWVRRWLVSCWQEWPFCEKFHFSEKQSSLKWSLLAGGGWVGYTLFAVVSCWTATAPVFILADLCVSLNKNSKSIYSPLVFHFFSHKNVTKCDMHIHNNRLLQRIFQWLQRLVSSH